MTMRFISSRGWIRQLLLAGSALLASGPLMAAPLTTADVESWSDATFGPALQAHRYSGLVIAVVQGDRVLFSKGYGYADYEARTPVDPAVTRFRIGSISKTFTATAVAQLIDAGAVLSIEDTAASYLRRVKLTGPQTRITLRDLLTHQGGFDAAAFGLGSDQPMTTPLTRQQVNDFPNTLVRPPGELSVYSNYGIALLGQIVEDVSGQKIRDYLHGKIFEPLAMHDTVLNDSTRPSPNLGVPYAFLPNGQAQKVPFLGVHPFIAPAGAVESTAQDMARYMLANLAEGRGSTGVVSPDSYARLHQRIAGNHPATSGFAMSFMTLDWNTTRFVGHGGDWPGFHSIMLFSPQEQVGFFIACMCEYPQGGLLEQIGGYGRFRANPQDPVGLPLTNLGIAQAFLTRFWGARHFSPRTATTDLQNYEGIYWHEDRNHLTAEKLLELTGGPAATLVVERDGSDHLRINGVGGYAPVAPGVFWNPKAEPTLSQNFWDSGLWAFSNDANGSPQTVSPTWGLDPYVRAGHVLNPRFLGNLAGVLTLVGLSGILALFWPAHCRISGMTKALPFVTIGVTLASVLVLFAGYPDGSGFVFTLLNGEPARFWWSILCANLAALLTLLMVIACVVAWRRTFWGERWRGVLRRLHFTILSAAAVGLSLVAVFFNLVGIHSP